MTRSLKDGTLPTLETEEKIGVTPAMIAAGVRVGWGSTPAPEFVAEQMSRIYRAMAAVAVPPPEGVRAPSAAAPPPSPTAPEPAGDR
jgi:hypothetical protein